MKLKCKRLCWPSEMSEMGSRDGNEMKVSVKQR